MPRSNTGNYASLSGQSGDRLHGSLNMLCNNITNLSESIYITDIATKKYVGSK